MFSRPHLLIFVKLQRILLGIPTGGPRAKGQGASGRGGSKPLGYGNIEAAETLRHWNGRGGLESCSREKLGRSHLDAKDSCGVGRLARIVPKKNSYSHVCSKLTKSRRACRLFFGHSLHHRTESVGKCRSLQFTK